MSGSSEDSDLENEWVERWVIVFTFTKKFPSSYLKMTGVVLSTASLENPASVSRFFSPKCPKGILVMSNKYSSRNHTVTVTALGYKGHNVNIWKHKEKRLISHNLPNFLVFTSDYKL